jgi:hypothetical protein
LTLRKVFLVIAAMIALSQSSLATAHHSFAMWTRNIATVTGTVKEYQWGNPHVWIILVVAGADGKEVQWGFESAAPGALRRRGWKNTSMKPGDKITVSFHTGRNNEPLGSITKVVLPDQSVLTAEDIISNPPG